MTKDPNEKNTTVTFPTLIRGRHECPLCADIYVTLIRGRRECPLCADIYVTLIRGRRECPLQIFMLP